MTGRAELVKVAQLPSGPGLAAVAGGQAVGSPLLATGARRPTVPSAAVLREGAERFVLVEEANTDAGSEYHKMPVVVGRESGGRVELLSGGVFPGDRVVTRGGHELGPFFAPHALRPSAEAARNIGCASNRCAW
jgi:multidrug efflux pump subunit AcrA (membrane-fusion protein)